jgi:hypothetical protein
MRSVYMEGLSKIQRRLTTQDFVQIPTGAFLRDWREDLREEAIDRAPIWRREIVGSLESQQDTAKFPLWARVFSDVPQSRWAEYGTGILSEDPNSARERYFPPVDRVRDWAEDHGVEPFVLAQSIFDKGGTPPTHFFSDAERAADARFLGKLERFGRAIERQAGIEP